MVVYRPGQLCSCSLAGDRGDPIPGVYLHSRLAFLLGACSGTGALPGALSTVMSQTLALSVVLPQPMVSLAVALSPVLLQTMSLRPFALLCCAVLKVILQENSSIFPKSQKQQSPDRSPGSRQPYIDILVFPLLNPSLAMMSSAGYFHARFLLSAFFSFLFFSDRVRPQFVLV